MAKKKKPRKKSPNSQLMKNVNKAIKDMWVYDISFKNAPVLTIGLPTAWHLNKDGRMAYSALVESTAISRASTHPQPWVIVTIVTQSDGEKSWYDHTVVPTSHDMITNSDEFTDLLNKCMDDIMSKINSQYSLSVSNYIFNGRNIDYDSAVIQVEDHLASLGAYNKTICLLGLQERIKARTPVFYEENRDKPDFNNLGKLLENYVARRHI